MYLKTMFLHHSIKENNPLSAHIYNMPRIPENRIPNVFISYGWLSWLLGSGQADNGRIFSPGGINPAETRSLGRD